MGLLIALGLEQGFEWMHRVHERHVLQRELHEEGERNEAALKMDFARVAALKDSLVAWHRGVDEAAAKGGGLSGPQGRIRPQERSVAVGGDVGQRESDRAGGLLSDKQTAVYSFLYQQEEPLKAQERDMASVAVEKQELERRFEGSFEDAGKDSVPDFSKMGVDDLKNYSAVLNREIAELDETAAMLHYFDAVNRAVLDGAESQEDIVRRVDEKRTEGGFVPTN